MLGARIPEVFGPDPALGTRNRGRPACGPSLLSGRLLPLSGSSGSACAVSLSPSVASSRRGARSLASLLGDKPRPAETLREKPAKACGRLSTGEQRGRKRRVGAGPGPGRAGSLWSPLPPGPRIGRRDAEPAGSLQGPRGQRQPCGHASHGVPWCRGQPERIESGMATRARPRLLPAQQHQSPRHGVGGQSGGSGEVRDAE